MVRPSSPTVGIKMKDKLRYETGRGYDAGPCLLEEANKQTDSNPHRGVDQKYCQPVCALEISFENCAIIVRAVGTLHFACEVYGF